MQESGDFDDGFPVLQETIADLSASTTVMPPRFVLDSAAEAIAGDLNEDENFGNEKVTSKRRYTLSRSENIATRKSKGRRTTSGRGSANERQKISRACDACKTYDQLDPREPNLWYTNFLC